MVTSMNAQQSTGSRNRNRTGSRNGNRGIQALEGKIKRVGVPLELHPVYQTPMGDGTFTIVPGSVEVYSYETRNGHPVTAYKAQVYGSPANPRSRREKTSVVFAVGANVANATESHRPEAVRAVKRLERHQRRGERGPRGPHCSLLVRDQHGRGRDGGNVHRPPGLDRRDRVLPLHASELRRGSNLRGAGERTGRFRGSRPVARGADRKEGPVHAPSSFSRRRIKNSAAAEPFSRRKPARTPQTVPLPENAPQPDDRVKAILCAALSRAMPASRERYGQEPTRRKENRQAIQKRK